MAVSPPPPSYPPIRITLVGAGLAGLAFAIHLATVVESLAKTGQPVRRVVIDVYDARLCRRESGLVDWLGPNDDPPNTRRQQIITVQDDVVRLFDLDGVAMSGRLWRAPGEVAWPSSRQCPIYVVEDRLVEWAQEDALKKYITLHPERMCLAKFETIKKHTQYLVIADGGGFSSFSQTPELGFHHTDLGDADTALGIYYERDVECAQVPALQAQNVYLTLFNTIYLVNSSEARTGFLNIRIPPSYMQHLHTSREPTIAKLEESTHTIARRTAQIIRAGLDLFAIPHDKVKAINYISLPMRCVYPPVRAVDLGTGHRFLAIVLGDAALKHHFWPGRGANSGFKGSINLSWHFLHFLISAPQRACSLLPPDFSKYVAFMAELKLREHEGRGEYITRIRIEDVFARVYGPVERNDGDPCAIPLPESGRAPADRSTPMPHDSSPDLPTNQTPHSLVQNASSDALDDVLFRRLVNRRNALEHRPPFDKTRIDDGQLRAMLGRLAGHDVGVRRLLVGSDEWPTSAMAFHDEVDPRHSFPCRAKVLRTNVAVPESVFRPPSRDTSVREERPRAVRTISRYARRVDAGLLAKTRGSLKSTVPRSGEQAAVDAIPSRVLLLCSKDAGKQREASAEVAACSPTKIAAVDVVLPLVRLLASNDVIVLRNACRALKNITETLDDARAAALNADALPALISVISRQRLWVQEEAAEALRTITTYNSTRASPIDVSDSAGEALVALLQSASVPLDVGSYHDGCSHDRNKHVRQALLLALINVTTTGDGECSAMVVKRGPREPKGEELAAFLEKPCRLLREGNVDIPELAFLLASADTTVQSQAARALGHFCADMARCKLRFSVAGVGSSLASGSIPVHLNSTNVGVQIRAALSVCFAANDSDRRDVIRAGVVPVLVRLLDSAHVGLQAAAVCALANILDIGSSGSKAADWGPGFAMDGTIVSALGRLLASNRNNAGVQKRAMSALTRTKLCPMLPPTHYDDAIRGVVPLLASTNAHLRIRAVITISSIADCEEHRAAAVSANAVPLLVRLLGSISVDTPWAGRTLDHLVLRSAVAAIRWLTQDVEPARRVARDDGAVRALIRLLAAHDVSVLVDAAYVLKHVVVRAGVSTGVVREAVPALEAILRGFRYSGHDVSVVRDVLAGLWRAEDAGVIV